MNLISKCNNNIALILKCEFISNKCNHKRKFDGKYNYEKH